MNSSGRLAHHAELEDILGIMNEQDVKNNLSATLFSAVDMERIPKCCPEDLNYCAVVDRQSRTEAVVRDLADTVASFSLSASSDTPHRCDAANTIVAVENLNSKLTQSISGLQAQLNQLSAVHIQSLKALQQTRPASAAVELPQSTPATRSSSTGTVDRSMNIIIFGITENANRAAWQATVRDVLSFAVGRTIETGDVFRLGTFTSGKTRPILVRLHSAWDRRLILSNAACLADDPRWESVFIRPDESPEERRARTVKRLKLRAAALNVVVSVNEAGDLVLEDKVVFSITDGWVDSDAQVLFSRRDGSA